MSKDVFVCSCGYTTHFEKALQAHCRFRHHEPKAAEPETIVPEIEAELKTAVKKTTKRKPKKSAEKE